MATPTYHVFTDGGCRGNPGLGGWAFIVYNQAGKRIGSKSKAKELTTNNEMELTAILEAITWATSKGYSLEISTDSAYAKNGIESWMWSWQKKGWVKADGGEVKNLQLWKELFNICLKYSDKFGEIPTIHKVKGHSGNPRNTEVDALVNVVMTELEMK